ncbi:transcription factor IIIB 50 kDa subunit-like [Antedon mediterranea]|uniref:transcription factor IIIB 50 kDa subunit-like n=1 Tax=Antedon mediterranea TaxID=105859 RepID=UPI003AF4BC9A
MSKVTICSECNSTDVENENINGHTTLICRGCGTVIDDNDINEENHDAAPIFHSSANLKALARNRRVTCLDQNVSKTKIMWGEMVKTFCKQFKFSVEMEKQAVDYSYKAFEMKEFYKRHSEQKRALSASCVYLTCRMHNWPVTINYVIDLCSVHREYFGTVFKQLVNCLGINLEFMKLEEIIPTYLKESGLEQLNLEKSVLNICCLSNEAWLVSGRQPIHLIIAAAYVAWRAVPENFKKKITDFSNRLTGKTKTWKTRVREIENVLFKLACAIPWKSSNTVNRNRIGLYVNDIMKYKLSLFSQFQITDDNDEDEVVPGKMEEDPKTVSESQELTDEDLPEDQLHMYLKSEQEVAMQKIYFDDYLESLPPRKKVKV